MSYTYTSIPDDVQALSDVVDGLESDIQALQAAYLLANGNYRNIPDLNTEYPSVEAGTTSMAGYNSTTYDITIIKTSDTITEISEVEVVEGEGMVIRTFDSELWIKRIDYILEDNNEDWQPE